MLNSRLKPRPSNSPTSMPVDLRMLTMQEAMDYLSNKGIPCKSRSTFYRIIKDFSLPYVNVNPSGKHEVRRFAVDGLARILKAKGLEP